MNVPIKCNLKHAEWGGQTAMCLQARDYKGFGTGTQLQNGVLVYAGNIPNDTRGGALPNGQAQMGHHCGEGDKG